MFEDLLDDIVQNLELIDKASVQVNWFIISYENIKMLCEFHRDKLWRLQIDRFDLAIIENEISIEIVEVLNEIKPSILFICWLNNSFENVKMCLNLNSMNIEVLFENSWKTVWKLELSNSPLLFFDSKSNQKLHFMCKSVVFEVNKDGNWDGFKEIVLLKANKTNQK